MKCALTLIAFAVYTKGLLGNKRDLYIKILFKLRKIRRLSILLINSESQLTLSCDLTKNLSCYGLSKTVNLNLLMWVYFVSNHNTRIRLVLVSLNDTLSPAANTWRTWIFTMKCVRLSFYFICSLACIVTLWNKTKSLSRRPLWVKNYWVSVCFTFANYLFAGAKIHRYFLVKGLLEVIFSFADRFLW